MLNIYTYICIYKHFICKFSNCFLLVILHFDTEHMLFKHLKKFVAFSFYSSPLKLYFLKLTSLSVHVGYIHRIALSDTISVVFKYHARNKYCRGAPLLTNTCRYQQTCPYIQLSTKLKSVVVRKGLLYGRKYRGSKQLKIEGDDLY